MLRVVFVIIGFAMLASECCCQTLSGEISYESCEITPVPGACQFVALSSSSRDATEENGIMCAANLDSSELLVSQYRGLQLVDTSSMTPGSVITGSELCPPVAVSQLTYNNNYLVSAHADGEDAATSSCFCVNSSDCRPRVAIFKGSDGSVWESQPIASQRSTVSVYALTEDVLEAPIVEVLCRGPQPWAWQTAIQNNPDSLAWVSSDMYPECAYDYSGNTALWLIGLGYKYKSEATAGLTSGYDIFGSLNQRSIVELSFEGSDQAKVFNLFSNNHTVNVTFGPSYLSSTISSTSGFFSPGRADAHGPGLASIESTTGIATSDTTAFSSAFALVDEYLRGGSRERAWASSVDGYLGKATRIDFSTGSPVYTTWKQDFEVMTLNYSTACAVLNWAEDGLWYDPFTGQPWPYLCVVADPSTIPFPYAFSRAALTHSVAFWEDDSGEYVVTSYRATDWCYSCTLANLMNVDLWRVNGTTVDLVQRFTDTNAYLTDIVISQGYLYYTNKSSAVNSGDGSTSNIQFWVPVSASGIDWNNIQELAQVGVPSTALVYERRLYSNATYLLVSYYAYGTYIYSLDPSTGVPSEVGYLPSFADPASEPVKAGAMWSCGDSDLYRANGIRSNGGVPGDYDLIDLEKWLVEVGPAISTTASSSTTTSTSTSSTGSAVSPSTQPLPSTTRTPSPSSASCITPDSCKYDCSYTEPSKLPKPSAKPSKIPAASKVADPKFFTMEVTYESTASECGADSPDCCDIKDWLGGDSVAASFFLCNSASETENRAPTYDAKAGTCRIFLAAQEGSDPGRITQAEFEAAVSALESSFSTLCPSDAKNCKLSTQTGKSLSYIVGGTATVIAASALLVITALVALL